MGKRRLWTGIISGAVIGGLVTLFNQDTRSYLKDTAEKTSNHVNHYMKHPDAGVDRVRQGVVSLNKMVTDNTDSAMNALSQVENALQKFLK